MTLYRIDYDQHSRKLLTIMFQNWSKLTNHVVWYNFVLNVANNDNAIKEVNVKHDSNS